MTTEADRAARAVGRASGSGLGELLLGAALGVLVAGLLEALVLSALTGRLASALGQEDLRQLSLRWGDAELRYGGPLVAVLDLVLFSLVTLGTIRVVRGAAGALSGAAGSATEAGPPGA
ncbi:hypothetical protein LX15_004534 [Streptoalloteichus tenebrarius]|uniref:Uncharacterized protein n=1 Tax=Streptoalloteichus tenebrarius (strain ATCC 17920 / DSM 40477 / JCM 4838 / CBS 697.72 / NBRC 16177 / NCIMB 11028 / NRRL B-12390 / A12253. 1 / ISP 5477) TaxID=1933 RepID=A0ABT1HZ93_STRSD|nr:hypothetical protein [Streptoalloteichus tenebrarius]MCP2260814.1 hypothetical protein [Streptoalloteichus tenebrarius]